MTPLLLPQGAGAGQQRAEDQQPAEAKEALPPPSRERADRKVAKNSSGTSTHHGGRGSQEGRGWTKQDKASIYDDSSDEGEPPPRPTPRVSAEVRQTPKHGREPPGRGRVSKAKGPAPRPYQQSDSDSDAPPARKSQPAAKVVMQDTDKSPKVSGAAVAREAPKKFPRKRAESRKGSHSGAKAEGSRGRPRRPPREFPSQETVVDSDSDQSVDVSNTSPEKTLGRGTPSRTPRETPRSMASPLKAPSTSPHVSPRLPPPPSKAKRVAASGLSASLGSDSPASKSEDEAESSGQAGAQRAEAPRGTTTTIASSSSSKGALVSRAFGAAAKKDRASREQEAADPKKKGKGEVRRPGGANRRDRSDKSVRGRAVVDPSVAAAAAPSPAPSPGGRAGKSPVVSAEPKVPIPQVQFVDGYPRLTCTIALSFIDKVPKPSVSVGGVKVEVKSEVKDEMEEEEEEEDRKTIFDNRTKEGKGKGKRKASEAGTKATEDESKQKIISSIFGIKRQDHESDDDKVKREVKKEEEESEEERGGRSSSLRPLVTVKQ